MKNVYRVIQFFEKIRKDISQIKNYNLQVEYLNI